MNIYVKFFNPENHGIMRTQSRDFGTDKIGRDPGIRDPGIPGLESLESRFNLILQTP